MKLDDTLATEYLDLPALEARAVINAMKKALKKNDIEALQWAARRIVWLGENSDTCRGDDEFFPAPKFNKAWKAALKSDPPPASIAGIIAGQCWV